MVQMATSSSAIQAEDYLWPLSTIRDTLLRPDPTSTPSPKLRSLLTHHLRRIRSPWSSFTPSSPESRTKLSSSSTITIPHTSSTLEIDDSSRQLALKLSDRIDVDAIECYVLYQSYVAYAIDDERAGEGKLERVMMWYAEEVEAVPGIAEAVLRLSREQEGEEWIELAEQIRAEMLPDPAKYLEGIFRAWSSLAQKPLAGNYRSEHGLFWATHQLRLQEALLDLLFLLLYQTPDRPASVSEGLIRGTVMSSFGTSQSNREVWEQEPECQRLQTRIRDLTLVIAIEAMCLATILTPGGDPPAQGTLLTSQDTLFNMHIFLLEQSDDLAPQLPELEEWDFPVWPMSILCLSWAVVLKSLSPELAPPAPGYNGRPETEMTSRALRLPSGLFPWLENVLTGPLFDEGGQPFGDATNDPATHRRKVIKDVMIGLTELVPFTSLVDGTGLYRVWELLFGGGSPSTSTALCADYWIADYPVAERRSPLDSARFPLEPAGLCTILSALVGAEAPQHTLESFGLAPASKVFEYFSQLTSVTHSVRPQWYRFISKDDQGHLLVEAIADILLPGGARIYAGQPGTVVNVEEPPSQAVTWRAQVPGWALLVEILRTAAGLRSLEEKTGANASGAVMELSVGELGIQGSASDIIAAGLKLLAAVLHPSAGLQADLFASLGSIGPPPHQILLELALAVLHSSATITDTSPADAASVLSALEVLQHLVHLPDIWQALRASAFFGSPTRRKCAAAALIQLDSRRAEHDIAVSLVRLVNALALSAMNIGHSDDTVMKGALHVVITQIWSQFGGWRYADIAKKYELATALFRLYDGVLSHPRSAEANGFSTAADSLIDVLVTSASPLTYRPIVDVLTQSPPLIRKLVGFRRRVDAALVTGSVTSAASFLATLLRVSVLLKTAPSALPKSVLSASVATPDKGQLIDALFGLAFSPMTQDTTTIALLKTVRTYLESVACDQQRPSLASMLRDAEKTCGRLANMASLDEAAEQRAAAWNLLSTIVATQPGCALFCFGASAGKVSGALKVAVEQTNAWEELLAEDPHALSATLGYVHSVLLCPSATKAVVALRNDSTFWQSVYDISVRPVPTPPTFTLSMHSEDFASRIQAYAFATQAKANATALLAAELAAVLDSEEDVETKVQSLVLGLWRNAGNLQEAAAMAVHSSCNPELHEVEGDKLNRAGVRLEGLRTVALPAEREYGRTYLYDGSPVVGAKPQQATVNLALDMLNLNWSMLDADIALTKSWHALADVISNWTEADPLAAKASLRAAAHVADLLADEERGGDVMLAIQVERLGILQVLLETALDPQVEGKDEHLLRSLGVSVRTIVESTTFSPLGSLRYRDTPAIHKPVLRILSLVFHSLASRESGDLVIDTLLEVGTLFTTEATDVILDGLVRGSGTPADLALAVAALCEIIRSHSPIWLETPSLSSVLSRSLELVVRTRLEKAMIPPHLPSILLLHLAIANHPVAAQKLAVSGILPAYSDNAIATEAESGRIEPSLGPHSVHSAWCGMLHVVKALLWSLPDTSSFVRSDVMPFMRVASAQTLRALSWDGEQPLTSPALQEAELVCEVFYGIARAVEMSDTSLLLADFGPPAVGMLKSIRHALSHPRVFSTLVVPSNEEEQAALEAELATVEMDKEADLVNVDKTPILANRIFALLRICRTITLTLMSLTKAWLILRGEEDLDEAAELVLPDEEGELGLAINSIADPVGVLNDIHLLVGPLSEKLSITHPESTAALRVVAQIGETTAIIATSQLLVRSALLPEQLPLEEDMGMGMGMGMGKSMGMDVDGEMVRRRVSMGGAAGTADRRAGLVRELEADLRGILGGEGDEAGREGRAGDRAVMRWLEGILERAFGEAP